MTIHKDVRKERKIEQEETEETACEENTEG
jgi:hypothetical protein